MASSGEGYFLYHSIGVFPDKARLIAAALQEFGEVWGAANDAQWSRVLQLRQEYIDQWRALINAPAGTLTTAENVTTALFTLVNSLPAVFRRRSRLLVAADCFPSLHFLLAGMADRHGFVLDTVPLRPGEHWVRDEDVLARWDSTVGIALLTSVTSTASYRCDLRTLIEHGKRMGTLIGVDITQSVGLFPFDVQASGADFAVSTSLKWLCGTPGAGILQVRKSLLDECRPELRGWFSQEDIFSWNLDSFAYAGDARRFDNGTPSILACVGTLPALRWHAAQDTAALLSHNRKLTEALLAAARELRIRVTSPSEDMRRGGAVMLKLDADRSATVLQKLRSAEIFADYRGHSLRLSPGCVTTLSGVESLFRVLKE